MDRVWHPLRNRIEAAKSDRERSNFLCIFISIACFGVVCETGNGVITSLADAFETALAKVAPEVSVVHVANIHDNETVEGVGKVRVHAKTDEGAVKLQVVFHEDGNTLAVRFNTGDQCRNLVEPATFVTNPLL